MREAKNSYVRRVDWVDGREQKVGPIGRVIRVEEYPEIDECAVLVGWPDGAEWEMGVLAPVGEWEPKLSAMNTVARERVLLSAYDLGERFNTPTPTDAPKLVHVPEPDRGPEELRPDADYLFDEDLDAVEATWDARVRAFDEDAEAELLARAAERVELAKQDVRVRTYPMIVLVDWERLTVEVRRSGVAAEAHTYQSRDEAYAAYRRIRAWAEAKDVQAQYCRLRVA